MPRGHDVDVEKLHTYLFRNTDRLGRIKLSQTVLADEIGITKFSMSRVVARMVEQGRIRKIGNDRRNRGVFVVEDPEVWAIAHPKEDDGQW